MRGGVEITPQNMPDSDPHVFPVDAYEFEERYLLPVSMYMFKD